MKFLFYRETAYTDITQYYLYRCYNLEYSLYIINEFIITN